MDRPGNPRQPVEESYRLRADADLQSTGDGGLVLRQSRFQLPLPDLGISRRATVLRLAEGWLTVPEINRLIEGLAGESRILQGQLLLRRLAAHGWLRRRLLCGERPVLEVQPYALGVGSQPPARRHVAGERYVLSRFAALQRDRGGLVASSPLSTVAVGCVDPRLAAVLAMMAGDACDVAAVADQLAVDRAVAGRVLDELLSARVLVSQADSVAEYDQAPLAFWSPEELRLHERSRAGRHALPIGGTYRFRGRVAPEPLHRTFPAAPVVPLRVPDLSVVAKTEEPLTAVVAARRTVRRNDADRPLTVDQLAEFLYRVQHTTAAGEVGGQQVGRRPYPGGGGIYELEIYPLVSRCAGLAPGLYHYDSMGHQLAELGGESAGAELVLRYARAAAGMSESPQVLLVITARVHRVMWKYEGMSYAMMLKNAGVLTELMYLVATSMGLAPCALGAGDSAAFAALADVDPLAEPSVAEFLLGSAPAGAQVPA